MNVFDLFARISLDTRGFEKGLNDSKSLFSKFGDGLTSAAGKLGDVLAGIGKAATVGIGAAGAALTALTKQTLDAVGSFEQLEGGAQKIFDEMDFEKISNDAKNAYRELNMSAAEYLESINLAGATFAQTMGDEKGYDTARKGMLAIADYASGTGRNLTELNQKFQMITRATSSYQSIADQFSGILPATSTAFLEQAQAAGFLSDTYEKLTEVPVAEYQQALTEMLDRGVNQLGLSNNTLRESTETLTGSFAMARAAWQNFLTGQGTVKDFTGALTSAIDQTRSKLSEIIPRLTDGLTELVDLIAPEIPPIIEETLPSIIDGASTLLTGLANRLPQLLTAILPSLAEGVVDVTTALVGVLPELITSLGKSIPIVVQTIMSKKDELLAAGKEIISAIVPTDNGSLEKVAAGASAIVTKFAITITNPENIKKVFDKGADILDAILSGLTSEESINALLDEENGIPKLLSNIGTTLVNLTDRLLDSAQKVVENLCKYLTDEDNQENIDNAAIGILTALGEAFVGLVRTIHHHIVDLMSNIAVQMVGEFDADATAFDMLSALAKALVRNAWRFSPFGAVQRIWNEHREQEAMEDYLNSGSPLTYERYLEEQERQITQQNSYVGGADYFASEYMLQHGYLQGAAADAYRRARGYATGFYADRPAWLNNVQVGERGDEVLLPLDTNTAWMDKLADKLGARMGGGIVVQFGDIHVYGNGNVGQEVISQIDSALRQYQIQQQRGIGGTGWQK